eukprot:31188_1
MAAKSLMTPSASFATSVGLAAKKYTVALAYRTHRLPLPDTLRMLNTALKIPDKQELPMKRPSCSDSTRDFFQGEFVRKPLVAKRADGKPGFKFDWDLSPDDQTLRTTRDLLYLRRATDRLDSKLLKFKLYCEPVENIEAARKTGLRVGLEFVPAPKEESKIDGEYFGSNEYIPEDI